MLAFARLSVSAEKWKKRASSELVNKRKMAGREIGEPVIPHMLDIVIKDCVRKAKLMIDT